VQRDGFLSAVARAVAGDDGKAVVRPGGSVCIVFQGDDAGDGVDGEARSVCGRKSRKVSALEDLLQKITK
jgi:hypothetical protein